MNSSVNVRQGPVKIHRVAKPYFGKKISEKSPPPVFVTKKLLAPIVN